MLVDELSAFLKSRSLFQQLQCDTREHAPIN